jgi:MtN3 and saliva related transmembrane protein
VTDTLAIAAAGWGILMALSPILQVRRMLATRSSADFSVGYLAVLLVGFGLWIAYGLALGNAAIVVPNLVALAIGVVTMAVAFRFRPARAA